MPQSQYLIDDRIWEQLNELTGGAAAVCFQCGVCTAACPWGLVRDESLSVRSYLRAAQLGLPQNEKEDLWLCTTCGQCEEYCPRGVNISDVFRGLRYLAWEKNRPHRGLPTILWSVFWNNNPWDQPPSQRSRWAKGFNLPVFQPDEHEILYYVGCSAAYETRSQKIAQALVKLLQAANVAFGTLEDLEPCSGEEVLSVGHKPYFSELSEKAMKTLNSRGVTRLVTSDPHSFDAFQNYYPARVKGFQPYHYTQYLDSLLNEGRLVLSLPLEARITFHDPCYLARHNHEVDSPRNVLMTIPGVELVEMEHTGGDTLCCGGGGGRMWLETDPGERFSDLRVVEALETQADILATACPYCVTCLEDSLKSQGLSNLVVLDVAEIAAGALSK